MNELLLDKYIKKLNIDHIRQYAKNNNIKLINNEDEIIYDYIKKYYKKLYKNDNNDDIFDQLKCKLSLNTYNNVLSIYNETKEKIKN